MKIERTINDGLLAVGVIGVTIFFATSISQAGPITWGAPTDITGDANVSTAGTLVGAFNLGDSGVPAASVNGVLFQSFALPNGSGVATVGNFSMAAGSFAISDNSLFGDPGNPPFNTLSAGYQSLLSSAIGTIDTFTLTVSGLSIGKEYQFQWWTDFSTAVDNVPSTAATAGNTVTLNSNVTATHGGLGQFAIGTFTADAANEVIRFDRLDPGEGGIGVVNAFQLREAAEPSSSVPDSGSTLAFGGLALAGFALMGRKIRQAPPLAAISPF